MSEAPERIWLTNFYKSDFGARLGHGTVSDLEHGSDYHEYVRADLLRAQLAAAEADRLAAMERVREAAANVALNRWKVWSLTENSGVKCDVTACVDISRTIRAIDLEALAKGE